MVQPENDVRLMVRWTRVAIGEVVQSNARIHSEKDLTAVALYYVVHLFILKHLLLVVLVITDVLVVFEGAVDSENSSFPLDELVMIL